jgi:hypothetical protein
MAEVEILIEGEFKKTKYKELNKQLAPIVRTVFKEIVNTIERKSKEFAAGTYQVPNHVGGQANHKIGQSESGYISTGKLSDSIEVTRSPVRGYSFSTTIKANSPTASNVEFGTGIYGPNIQTIKPKTPGGTLTFNTPKFGWVNVHEIKGQRPNPFMRGAVWWAKDHISEIARSAQKEFKGSLIRSQLDISMEL